MKGLQGVEVKEARQPKRIYVRNGTNRIAKETRKVRRVLNNEWPETITCKVCYKKDVPVDDAILRLGINGERGNYWMCKSHL
jgi:hypothetical protein